jgi:hypothetical protein
MSIEAEHYGQTRRALQADPIIGAMAAELRGMPAGQLVHEESGTPRHEFMMGALREYQRRGGQIGTHIGGPAEAILALLKSSETVNAWLDEAEAAGRVPEPGEYGYEGPCDEHGDSCDNDHEESA